MNHSISDNTPTMETVQEQLAAWRSNRANKRESIPRHLWRAAAELCREHSLSHVCRLLRLSFTDLKKHIPDEQQPATQFMQIDMSSISDRWQVECSRPDGSQLRVSGNGHVPGIETTIRAFLS